MKKTFVQRLSKSLKFSIILPALATASLSSLVVAESSVDENGRSRIMRNLHMSECASDFVDYLLQQDHGKPDFALLAQNGELLERCTKSQGRARVAATKLGIVNETVNFETPLVSPLAMTPDRTKLLVVNIAAHRLDVFDITGGSPVATGYVPVGVDPVSVRARDNSEVWVVNHISDSISIVNLDTMSVEWTLRTGNEPTDVVFAGNRAFVSLSEKNEIRVYDSGSLAQLATIAAQGEEPRAMAVSPDGDRVYVAMFESGNATTTVNGRLGPISTGAERGSEKITTRSDTPYGGTTPVPNSGQNFVPARTAGATDQGSIIVRKDDNGRWRDDNIGDWTSYISGSQANLTRRVPGWDLPDRDVLVINTASMTAERWQPRLMNIAMHLGVNPVSGDVTVVGTEATNEIRFEPNINGTFVKVVSATFGQAGGAATIRDMNPHLDYSTHQVPQSQRNRSIGDPRGVAWNSDGTRMYVTGMGSNNVVVFDSNGNRAGRIEVGQGPTGIVLDDARNRGYVLNKFAGSVSHFRLSDGTVLGETTYFDPTPAQIKAGRPFLYDTHLTSGLGQASCASCHVDARTDRLAWDLGNPSGQQDGVHHPMKGAMLTQSLIDIMRHPNLHWRGDRDSLSEFNPAFTNLMGDDRQLTAAEMQQFADFLDTTYFPPNPYRNIDNTLPTSMTLPSNPLATSANASAGRTELGGCIGCHYNNQTRTNLTNSELSQNVIPPAFHGLYDRLGFHHHNADSSTTGFGYFHDGADPLLTATRGTNLLAAILTIEGPGNGFSDAMSRQDVHAAVGRQLTITQFSTTSSINEMFTLAESIHVGMIAKVRQNGVTRGYTYIDNDQFIADTAGGTATRNQLVTLGQNGTPVTLTLVVEGTENRLGVDRDLDGVRDFDNNTTPEFTSPGNQQNSVGDSVSLALQAIDADGDDLSWQASGLPAGLTLNTSTGVISGTLTTATTANVTLTAIDARGAQRSQSITWQVDSDNTGGTTVLVDGDTASGSVAQGTWEYYTVQTTASDTTLIVNMTGLTADADLYVNADVQPVVSADFGGTADCTSLRSLTTDEVCHVTNSGATEWHIGIYGYRASDYTLSVTVLQDTGNNGSDTLTSGVPTSTNISAGEWHYYTIDATQSDTQLDVLLNGLTNDIDLYVRAGARPTGGVTDNGIYDCGSYAGWTTPESCQLANTGATTWHIAIHGYKTSSYTLKATLSDGNNGGGNNEDNLPINAGEPVDSTISQGNWHYYEVALPDNASLINVTLSGLTDDVDLYVRADQRPTGGITDAGIYDCGSYRSRTQNEICSLSTTSNTYVIGVHGYRASDYRLSVTTDADSGLITQINSGDTIQDQSTQGEWTYYQLTLDASQVQFEVTLTGMTADSDLYVRQGQIPAGDPAQGANSDCVSFHSQTSDESCVLNNSGDTQWFIGVYGYRATPYTLSVSSFATQARTANRKILSAKNETLSKGITTGGGGSFSWLLLLTLVLLGRNRFSTRR